MGRALFLCLLAVAFLIIIALAALIKPLLIILFLVAMGIAISKLGR